jgi:hypothetical protein
MVSAVGLLFRRRGQLENQQMKVGHIIRPTRLARLVPDADKVFRQVPKLGCRLPGSRRLGNLIYFARFYIVDKAVDRNMLGNERMIANPSNILCYAFRIVLKCMPMDVMTGYGAAAMLRVGPCLSVELGGLQIILEQVSDDFACKKLHTAIAVVNDKPFLRAE